MGHRIAMPGRPSVGDLITHRVTVTTAMTARLFDREVHPVYATAWMVRHIEEAGRLLVEPHLGPDEDATGYSITLIHERPAAVGEQLTITALVTAVDERQCTAQMEVAGSRGVVGRATFVQRYVRKRQIGGTP
jgi:fluoroacetyl-CoA thioesterase